jgi:hypothetical protein
MTSIPTLGLAYEWAGDNTQLLRMRPPTALFFRPALLRRRRTRTLEPLRSGALGRFWERGRIMGARCACAGLEPLTVELGGDGSGGAGLVGASGFRTAHGAACVRTREHRAEAAAGADAAPGPAGGPALPGDGGCGHWRFGPGGAFPFPLPVSRVPRWARAARSAHVRGEATARAWLGRPVC